MTETEIFQLVVLTIQAGFLLGTVVAFFSGFFGKKM